MLEARRAAPPRKKRNGADAPTVRIASINAGALASFALIRLVFPEIIPALRHFVQFVTRVERVFPVPQLRRRIFVRGF